MLDNFFLDFNVSSVAGPSYIQYIHVPIVRRYHNNPLANLFIRQIFFHQTLWNSTFTKHSPRQTFPLYSIEASGWNMEMRTKEFRKMSAQGKIYSDIYQKWLDTSKNLHYNVVVHFGSNTCLEFVLQISIEGTWKVSIVCIHVKTKINNFIANIKLDISGTVHKNSENVKKKIKMYKFTISFRRPLVFVCYQGYHTLLTITVSPSNRAYTLDLSSVASEFSSWLKPSVTLNTIPAYSPNYGGEQVSMALLTCFGCCSTFWTNHHWALPELNASSKPDENNKFQKYKSLYLKWLCLDNLSNTH